MKKKTVKEVPVDISGKLKDIGERVKTQRKKIANNYENFAAEHRINKVTVGRIENGENYKMDSLLRVLNAIGITLEDLLK
jgi:ribosome-binding protein aMBF1 (putative translation factor)